MTAAGLGWFVVVIAGFARRPIEVDGAGVLLRTGIIRAIQIPLASITGVRRAIDPAEVRSKAVLNLAMIAYPNIIVDLAEPIALRRRHIRAVAHRLDDPAAFADAIEALGAGA